MDLIIKCSLICLFFYIINYIKGPFQTDYLDETYVQDGIVGGFIHFCASSLSFGINIGYYVGQTIKVLSMFGGAIIGLTIPPLFLFIFLSY